MKVERLETPRPDIGITLTHEEAMRLEHILWHFESSGLYVTSIPGAFRKKLREVLGGPTRTCYLTSGRHCNQTHWEY